MSEARAHHYDNPEIGDVLASIRQLISQEDAGPDFTRPIRRLDAAGNARSALALGPKSEMLRSVIERELSVLDGEAKRLVLGAQAIEAEADPLPQVAEDEIDASDALTRLRALTQEARDESDAAETTPETDAHIKEDSMNAATPIRSAQTNGHAEFPQGGFDLFAAETGAEDEQMTGGTALRNLVCDVIRQELQGEMGDRISRNLRRAIRHEVAAVIEAGLKT